MLDPDTWHTTRAAFQSGKVPANGSVKSLAGPVFGSVRRRSTVHLSRLMQIEDGYIPYDGPFPSGFEDRYQIAIPYHGIFSYAVGKRSWTLDANQSLFITKDWEAKEKHLVSGLGHAAIIMSPAIDLLDEIAGCGGIRNNPAFAAGVLPSSIRLKLLAQHVLRRRAHFQDTLHNDEWAIQVLREAMNAKRPSVSGSSDIVNRAKEILHARSGERLVLGEIAREVGVSPAYLTQEFSRREGSPLYRYQLKLRLARALVELPHCDDITGLALDLGFSSHSHFTVTFRNMFGITPAEYRASVGTRKIRLPDAANTVRQIFDRGETQAVAA